MDIDVNSLIQQFPSLLGLFVCIVVLIRQNSALQQENSRLIETIIKGENCDDNT